MKTPPLLLAFLCLAACDSNPQVSGTQDSSDSSSPGGAPATEKDGDSSPMIIVGQGGATTEEEEPVIIKEIEIITELPADFVGADNAGGWKVVGPIDEVGAANDDECANVLRVIARDFPASHSDFQAGSTGLKTGIVNETLGDDRKPTYADPGGKDLVSSAESFDQWYRNVEGENLPFVMDLWLEPVDDTFVFHSNSFFPLKDAGYALESCENCGGQADGFHFTTELHTRFEYKGGEEFTFIGDDDVWVFINDKLAMDLGGVHAEESGTVLLDDIAEDFGLEVGGVYAIDLFQAERQTSQSNFRIETTLDFTGCGEILPTDIVK